MTRRVCQETAATRDLSRGLGVACERSEERPEVQVVLELYKPIDSLMINKTIDVYYTNKNITSYNYDRYVLVYLSQDFTVVQRSETVLREIYSNLSNT